MSDLIRFGATIAQVKTMADGGLRLVLDLPEDAIAAAALLMARVLSFAPFVRKYKKLARYKSRMAQRTQSICV